MLIVNPDREVDWPVEIPVPQDGGSTVKAEVMVRFKLATKTEIFGSGDTPPKKDLLPSRILGWGTAEENHKDGFVDGKEKPIPFTPENLKAVLNIGYIERALALALVNASNGAAAKN